MLFKKKILLAKIETTYGTDSTPTGAANAIRTIDCAIQTMQGNTVDLAYDKPGLGNDPMLHTGPYTVLTFSVPLAGSGAAGTVPGWGVLMRACGFSETIVAATSVTYQPVSANYESATMYYNIDGELHKLLGVRGNVSFELNKETLPVAKFTFTGLRVPAAAGAAPTPTYTAFVDPLPVNKTNTPTLSIHSYAPRAETVTFDMANQVVYRNVIGDERVQINDRKPTAAFGIEKPTLAQKDYELIIAGHTRGAVQLVHGTAAGNIITFDMPSVQLAQPSMGNSDGLLTYSMNGRLVPTTANDDEIKIKVT